MGLFSPAPSESVNHVLVSPANTPPRQETHSNRPAIGLLATVYCLNRTTTRLRGPRAPIEFDISHTKMNKLRAKPRAHVGVMWLYGLIVQCVS